MVLDRWDLRLVWALWVLAILCWNALLVSVQFWWRLLYSVLRRSSTEDLSLWDLDLAPWDAWTLFWEKWDQVSGMLMVLSIFSIPPWRLVELKDTFKVQKN